MILICRPSPKQKAKTRKTKKVKHRPTQKDRTAPSKHVRKWNNVTKLEIPSFNQTVLSFPKKDGNDYSKGQKRAKGTTLLPSIVLAW